MNSDLIRRQDAIDALDCINGVEEVLRSIPSAQPTIEPRTKGEWVYGEHDVAMCDGYRCSHCGFFVPWDYSHAFIDFIKDYHFCPSCGYPMRGESDG